MSNKHYKDSLNGSDVSDFSFTAPTHFNPQAQSTAYLNDRTRQNIELNESVIVSNIYQKSHLSSSKGSTNKHVDFQLEKKSNDTNEHNSIRDITFRQPQIYECSVPEYNRTYNKENVISKPNEKQLQTDKINVENIQSVMKNMNVSYNSKIGTSVLDSFLNTNSDDFNITNLLNKFTERNKKKENTSEIKYTIIDDYDGDGETGDDTICSSANEMCTPTKSDIPSPQLIPALMSDKKEVEAKLKCNRYILKWLGLPIRSELVKSFYLTLYANEAHDVTIYIRQNQSDRAFHLSDDMGNPINDRMQITIKPHDIVRIFVKFLPSSTCYFHGSVIVEMCGKKNKVNLFGYLDSARVRFINEEETPVTNSPNDLRVIRLSERNWDRFTSQPFIVQNEGGYRAFVTLFNVPQSSASLPKSSSQSLHPYPQITFHPHSFILAPKCTQTIHLKFNAKYQSQLAFNIVFVDEDLRCATREFVGESDETVVLDKKYSVFTTLKLFTKLDNEDSGYNVMSKYKEVDWRSSLLQQINNNWCMCIFDVTRPSSSSKQQRIINRTSTSNSASHISISDNTNSSLFSISQKSDGSNDVILDQNIMNQLELRYNDMWFNSNQSQIPCGVSLNCSVLTMPDTPIGHVSYGCVVLSNHNMCPIRYRIEHESLNTSEDNSSASCNSTSKTNSSVYSFNHLPNYDDLKTGIISPHRSDRQSNTVGHNCGFTIIEPMNTIDAVQHSLIPFKFYPTTSYKSTTKVSCAFRIILTFSSGQEFYLPLNLQATVLLTGRVKLPRIRDINLDHYTVLVDAKKEAKYSIGLTQVSLSPRGSCEDIKYSYTTKQVLARQLLVSPVSDLPSHCVGNSVLRNITNRKCLINFNMLQPTSFYNSQVCYQEIVFIMPTHDCCKQYAYALVEKNV